MKFIRTGYEYEIIGFCRKTSKPAVAPIAWSYERLDKYGRIIKVERPHYHTCNCKTCSCHTSKIEKFYK